MNSKLLAMAAILCTAVSIPASAQKYSELQTAPSPLILRSQGSFYVGGMAVPQTASEIGLFGPGSVFVNQMYVQYMVPDRATRTPVVMMHGATLSGKSFETTPDGRMGWVEHFVRNGYPVYNTDQIGRARSGFNQAAYNAVRAGTIAPDKQPNIWRIAAENAWVRFRMGPKPGDSFPDSQFPAQAGAEFAKQAVPDLSAGLPQENPNIRALAELAAQLKGAVMIAHSQAGRFPLDAALADPTGARALVAIEPPGCNAAGYTDQQISSLSRIPILVVFGDYLATPQPFGSVWQIPFDDCKRLVDRVNAAGGRARMMHTPELGIKGNSHMLMQDRNSLQIADLIIKWIEESLPR